MTFRWARSDFGERLKRDLRTTQIIFPAGSSPYISPTKTPFMEGMHFCPQCGGELQPANKFCHHCGAALAVPETPPAVTVPEPPPHAAAPPEPAPHVASPLHVPPVASAQQVPPVASPLQVPPAVSPQQASPAASPQQVSPAASSLQVAPKKDNATTIALILAILIIGGSIGWYLLDKDKKADYPFPGSSQTESTTPFQSPIPDLSSESSGSSRLQAYVGEWKLLESNETGEWKTEPHDPDDDLFIELTDGQLVMYPRSQPTEKMKPACNQPVGPVLSCRLQQSETGKWATITLELSTDGQHLTFSFLPDEETEKMMVKLERIR